MRQRLLHHVDGLRTFALVFDKGDNPIDLLTGFAEGEQLTGSSFTGIGAFRKATLGYFDRDRMDYDTTDIDEQCEILSLLGDVAIGDDGSPSVHAHVTLGRRDFTAIGGHLVAGAVWPTLELVLQESPEHLRKRPDAETGLALIRP